MPVNQIVHQSALVDLPALGCTAVLIQEVVRVHKMCADIMHIQLTDSCQPHIAVPYHAAGNNARLLNDAVRCNIKFLHIGQAGAILKISAGNGL